MYSKIFVGFQILIATVFLILIFGTMFKRFSTMEKQHTEIIGLETKMVEHLKNIDENYSVLTK